MLHIKPTDFNDIWKTIIRIRRNFLFEDSGTYYCLTLISESRMKENIDNVEKELKLKVATSPFKKVSKETLRISAEMFTYLNYCPHKHLSFYASNLFKTATMEQIILALSKIMKTSPSTGRNKIDYILTKYPLLKIMKSFNLETYKNIQIITKGKDVFFQK